MTASTPVEEFGDVLHESDTVVAVQQVGGYLSVRIGHDAPKLNEGGIAQNHGWAVVAVEFGTRTVLLAPIDHLADLRPTGEALAEVVVDDVLAPEAGGPS